MKINYSDQDVLDYLANHSYKDTITHFNISQSTIKKIKTRNNIITLTPKQRAEHAFQELLRSIDKEEFIEFYRTHTRSEVLEKYSIGKTTYNKLLEVFEVQRLSPQEAMHNSFINKYGSIEEGLKVVGQKVKTNLDYKARNQVTKDRHGYISPFEQEEVRNKAKSTFINKYGVDNPFKVPEIQFQIHKDQETKYNGIGFASPELRTKYNIKMQELYGVDWACLLPQCINKSNGANSTPNLQFQKLLTLLNIPFETEFVLNHYRFDFKIENILIEINPSFTHNSTFGYRNNEVLPKDYHLKKSRCAINNGYRCIHIWDWDIQEKILNSLIPRTSIYARKCIIQEVNKKECKEFLDNYHFQNSCNGQIFRFGLYYNNELIQLMTFGKPRYNHNFEYELLRLCTKPGIKVIGGAERLFKYFKSKYDPSSIISYCDNSKFAGHVYERLDMKLVSQSHPTIHWYNCASNHHITDNLLRQRGFDQLFHTNYGKGTSNEELMLNHGYLKIYDCGQARFEYKKDS